MSAKKPSKTCEQTDTTPKNSLKTLKAVVELLDRHNLDFIEFNGIKVGKSKHLLSSFAKPTAASGASKTSDQASHSSPPGQKRPPISIEEIDAMNRGIL